MRMRKHTIIKMIGHYLDSLGTPTPDALTRMKLYHNEAMQRVTNGEDVKQVIDNILTRKPWPGMKEEIYSTLEPREETDDELPSRQEAREMFYQYWLSFTEGDAIGDDHPVKRKNPQKYEDIREAIDDIISLITEGLSPEEALLEETGYILTELL